MDNILEVLAIWVSKNFDWNTALLIVLLVLILVWLYKSPDIYRNRVHDDRTADAAQQLQIDSYYRDANGQYIKENLDWWNEFLIDPEKKAHEMSGDEDAPIDQEHINLLNKRMAFIMEFSSARTVKLLSIYMQKTYAGDIDSDGTLVCISYIVASLRADYTGEKALPMDLLQIKFKDYGENEKKYQKISRTIKKETGIDDHLNYRRLK
ncbi:hypothetical protein KZR06_15980 (plasmid) [Lacticaseibacillus paracasei]|uniref:hypothetical protein n=1 Tax=Lacticaseibacillus paracasei TaxID=1597 RepID=UPI0021A39B83|nr:hypothetical protein [Lacticaseibacillus paracasei]UWP78304.1 hypothetical protein KZR06_15980 [Lacticaseibacillus paracasei]